MKVLLTGANGFIGRHVLTVLIESGHKVTALVRKGKVDKEVSRICSIVEYDITFDNESVSSILPELDAVIHLAWGGLPKYDSLHHIEQEMAYSYNFLKHVIAKGVCNITVAGTCFEYGMKSGALSETIESKPHTAYGYAKNALREQLQFLQRTTFFNLNWLRLFYMFGKDQPEHALYPQILSAVNSGKKIFNMSGGEQLRDYLPVETAAHMIVQIVEKKVNSGIVNVCRGRPISVRRQVETWIKKNGWEIEINPGYYPYSEFEPFAFWGENKKLRQLIE